MVNFNVTTLCKCNNQQRVYRKCDCRSESRDTGVKNIGGTLIEKLAIGYCNWEAALVHEERILLFSSYMKGKVLCDKSFKQFVPMQKGENNKKKPVFCQESTCFDL